MIPIGRHQTEEAEGVGAPQSYLAAIVESSNDAIIGKTLDGIITSWNRGAERIYGYTAQEAIGQSITILGLPDRPDEILGILKRIAAGDRVDHFETKRRHRDGTLIGISLSVSPIRSAEGKIVGASAIARDVTAARKADEALRNAHHELRERTQQLLHSNTELQRFAYIASHDLQEPARTVASYCDLLEQRYRDQLDATAREWIGHARAGAQRMRTLIADLLEYSRLESKARPFALADCEVVLADALENLRTTIDESRALVTHDPLPSVIGDASQLMQLFQNLVGNAIKFHGQEAARVHVGAQRHDDEWRFTVRDNIEPQHLEKIFEVFRRLHPQGYYPGTGIGLAICRRIVEQHRGRIWIEAAPGGGSEFCFSIPIRMEPQP